MADVQCTAAIWRFNGSRVDQDGDSSRPQHSLCKGLAFSTGIGRRPASGMRGARHKLQQPTARPL